MVRRRAVSMASPARGASSTSASKPSSTTETVTPAMSAKAAIFSVTVNPTARSATSLGLAISTT